MDYSKVVIGSEKVLNTLGFWPSFHDAEVISFHLDRGIPVSDSVVANLIVHFRSYTTYGEGTAQYCQKLAQNVLITFQFRRVAELNLDEFNHQNVINSIEISQISPIEKRLPQELHVCIESIFGFGAEFVCAEVEVISVKELGLEAN